MFKQFQQLPMQNKHQELDDFRGQNAINQLPLKIDKQSSGTQFGILNTGIRVRDPSEMFTFGDTKWVQGFSNRFTDSRFKSSFQESAGLLTKNTSQQDGIFGKSFLSNQSTGSVDQKPSDKKDTNSLGTERFENIFAKPKNSSDFNLIRSANSNVLMQTAVSKASSSDKNPKTGECGPKSSGNMFQLLHKVDEEHTHSASILKVPKIESDDNKNNSSQSPYCGLILTTKSQNPKSENNQLPNQNRKTSSNIVSVKKEDGQRRSTGTTYIRFDSPSQQNPFVTKTLDVANQQTEILKSKKRKCSTVKCLQRNKKVSKGSSRLHDISTGELEWARSTGRLPEKMNKFTDELADSCWITNGKIRLSLTTKLMQMLFQPPPANILSEDAITHCETITYYASKLTPNDACRLHLSSGRKSSSKSSNDEDLIKIIEAFVDRSKRLEGDVSRLEKERSLIFEVKMDSKDLEKVSFINRLAKFHARRPKVSREKVMDATSSSSTAQKLYLERYVEAIPMPETVPEGQDCLFL